MKQTSGPARKPAEAVIKDIRRATRRQFSAEEKIRIVLDDFSRYLVAWKLCATMQVGDVTATPDLALTAAGLDPVQVVHRPRLRTDNGSSYVAGDLADWLNSRGLTHIRGARATIGLRPFPTRWPPRNEKSPAAGEAGLS